MEFQLQRLVFCNLILLGMDSAFAFLEAIVTVLGDTVHFKDTPKHILLLLPCTLGWLFSIIYCTDAGLNFLGAFVFGVVSNLPQRFLFSDLIIVLHIC